MHYHLVISYFRKKETQKDSDNISILQREDNTICFKSLFCSIEWWLNKNYDDKIY